MKLRLNQIKYKLLLAFFFISTNLIILAGVSLFYFHKAEDLRVSENEVLGINLLVQKLINNDNMFFSRETANANYFKTGQSKYLMDHEALLKEINNAIQLLSVSELADETKTKSVIDKIKISINIYDKDFKTLLKCIQIRGFKDSGLEGEMRYYSHKLENNNLIPLVYLLMLRRHEKDFFIRKEMSYVDKYNLLCKRLEKGFLYKMSRKSEARITFDRYKMLFNEIVKQDVSLGLYNNTGYKQKIVKETENIEGNIEKLRSFSHQFTEGKIQQGNIFFGATVSLSIFLSLVLGYFLAKNLSDPITRLAREMYDFNVNQQLTPTLSIKKEDTEEIQTLKESFIHMATAIQIQFSEITEKSDLLEGKNTSLNKLNKELDKFIYSASHDLKAPLSSLLGLIYLMKHDLKNREQLEYLGMMEKNIHKLETHIKEIINYAKNHQLDIAWQTVDLKLMLENIVDMLKYQQGAESIRVIIDINEYEDFVSDNMRLNMILFNLISNAYKYHDYQKNNQTIKITASIESEVSVLSIEDNGLGIDSDQIDKIFNLFYRASEKSTGSGLGLYIVKEAVDKLGGEIQVVSEIGIGSKFTIKLPKIGQTSFLGLTSTKSSKLIEKEKAIYKMVS